MELYAVSCPKLAEGSAPPDRAMPTFDFELGHKEHHTNETARLPVLSVGRGELVRRGLNPTAHLSAFRDLIHSMGKMLSDQPKPKKREK
jgi:hypothetical protein